MPIELYPKDALITAAIATKRPVAFLVGSPLSLKDGLGVPGVNQMLNYAREEILAIIPFAILLYFTVSVSKSKIISQVIWLFYSGDILLGWLVVFCPHHKDQL